MYRNMIVLIECVVSNSERNPERVCLTFFSHVCVTFCPGYEAGCFEVCVCRGGVHRMCHQMGQSLPL